MNKGIVIKTTGSWHTVKGDDDYFNCRLKGNFRMRGIKTTNPIAVGDNVMYEVTGIHAGIITKILERKNYIIRRATNLSKETQIRKRQHRRIGPIMKRPGTGSGFDRVQAPETT